jgi:hypothetical protein
VGDITHEYPPADIVLAGDLNQLYDCDVVERTRLTQIVRQSIRGANILDRVFVSSPDLYGVVRVVTSVVRSDHKAVVVFANRSHPQPKIAIQRTHRRQTPAQHVRFLQHMASIDLTNQHPSASSDPAINSQTEFDHFYMIARNLMDQFNPEQTIALTSRDPPYVTPSHQVNVAPQEQVDACWAGGRSWRAVCSHWTSHPAQIRFSTESLQRQGRRRQHMGGGKATHWTSGGSCQGGRRHGGVAEPTLC